MSQRLSPRERYALAEIIALEWKPERPLSRAEIAELLGMSEGNVAKIQGSAMEKLRALCSEPQTREQPGVG